ncbi:unnamed protein product [Heterobilharzia americana]|nr:unnamed protein product [Heterobilharzia americana]
MLIEVETGMSGFDFELSKEGKALNVQSNLSVEKAGIKDEDLLYAVPFPLRRATGQVAMHRHTKLLCLISSQ